MFLIRAAFWLTLLILILPAETPQQNPQQVSATTQKMTTGEFLEAAKSTVSDVSSICVRQPEVCSAGAAAWDIFVRKAQYGAGLLVRAVSGEQQTVQQSTPVYQPSMNSAPQKSAKETTRVPSREAAAQPTAEPARASVNRAPAAAQSSNTLTNDDRRPMWRDPRTGSNA